MEKHSKWPIFMRMHGSVMPKMILPLLSVAAWSTLITLISKKVHPRKNPWTFG
jgi:predicted membrane chloride channel (bestrophin family)